MNVLFYSRFLKQWVMEGVINDPYEEFFIRSDSKYLLSRGRTYWTRSYKIREDLVPDFLVDLRFDVLSCGKTMNLLKCCNHLVSRIYYDYGKKFICYLLYMFQPPITKNMDQGSQHCFWIRGREG